MLLLTGHVHNMGENNRNQYLDDDTYVGTAPGLLRNKITTSTILSAFTGYVFLFSFLNTCFSLTKTATNVFHVIRSLEYLFPHKSKKVLNGYKEAQNSVRTS